jgi:hypothetical protein
MGRTPPGDPSPTPRCREPRCPCQHSPLWRDRTPDDDVEDEPDSWHEVG